MSLSPLAPSPDEARHWAKRFRTEIASSTSTFPLESVKTRIQSYPDGFTSCVRKVWLDEGLKGFWRGVLIPLVSVTVVRTVSFSVYQKAKYKSSAFIATVTGKEEPLIVVNKPGPFELTKNAMVIAKQIAATSVGKNENPIRISYENKGTWRTARQIVKNCGFLGLWSGFQLQMIRETFGTAMYFIVYESGKQLAVKYQGHDSPTSPLAVTAAGGLCGMAGLVSVS
ncbi:MAG: hypothetical protein LQ340_001371 [Diploschistes diacapsis]|nr:MAG: hypothetical protein LQ340_001371 [Diploschistes diacapsis]